ncbi:MAG: hypothetical protein COU46_02690 [Candidatus Niyogibacteria bacterium CG10_big_fil_rev_8_21_14_0_10_42_19]|uniref:Thioredoxin-like fold domain-containing protein n=1 Tax=Candidatus Niyogibacteria bacterium CG10_big_fil_rev_8_21_14_0_10_42_19 TaxID=1974725 RepID=A0A2H0TF97_9BACT|nr:MAG: hypothetical protein COU46_02690 [Candidatus Niyogibacteria bacterium CG10_big_fil_rev_8_21_14_0_10_42_19]
MQHPKINKNNGSNTIPIAIIIAGLLIAGAIYLRPEKAEKNAKNDRLQTAGVKIKQIDEDDDPTLGNPAAFVTFVYFGDYRCQYCARFQSEIKPTIMEKYVKTGKIKYVYRDLITMGENSILTAEAANCAGDQDKYWEFANYLHDKAAIGGDHAHGSVYTTDDLLGIASSLELNVPLFKECLLSEKHKAEIEKDTKDASANGATGTPAVFINGRLIDGLNPLEEYERIINEELLKK